LSKPPLSITKQALSGLAALAIVLWLTLFIPAWTLNYWQAWIYWLVFVTCVTAISVYFIKKGPKLIEKRVKAGPGAKNEMVQKVVQSIAAIFFILILLIPSLDHDFKWSNVSAYISIVSYFFVVIGLLIVFLVFKANSFASTTIEVEIEQKVITKGAYGVVRHPMYSGALLMLLFTPIALDSFWGLLAFPPILAAMAIRLVKEEKFPSRKLNGYTEYCQKVKYRLIPFIW
jgi:protein-S-isoprenylcysteine O-methyltransferase Ste14